MTITWATATCSSVSNQTGVHCPHTIYPAPGPSSIEQVICCFCGTWGSRFHGPHLPFALGASPYAPRSSS